LERNPHTPIPTTKKSNTIDVMNLSLVETVVPCKMDASYSVATPKNSVLLIPGAPIKPIAIKEHAFRETNENSHQCPFSRTLSYGLPSPTLPEGVAGVKSSVCAGLNSKRTLGNAGRVVGTFGALIHDNIVSPNAIPNNGVIRTKLVTSCTRHAEPRIRCHVDTIRKPHQIN
jgi:hypothetical protein